MKQMIFMALTTFLGVTGSFVITPLWGIAVYYGYAVLRPGGIWEFAEAMGMTVGDIQWSRIVAAGTLLATAMWRCGVLSPVNALRPPWYGNPKLIRSHYLFLGFTFWIGLSYPMAISLDRAEPWFWEYVKIFVMFLCATLVLRTVRDLWVIYYVVLGCAVYAGYEINMYYFKDGVMYLQSRGYGGLDNNGAALIVAMAIPLAYFAWEASSHWTRWGFLLLIPILLHALMLSFSRGGMVSLGAAAIVVWFRSRHKWFLSVVYLIGAVFFAAAAGPELWDRIFSIGEYKQDESAQSRWTTWNIAIRMANEDPLFGKGIRCSTLLTKAYGADMEGRAIHSQYLQTAADSGWVALFLYLSLLLSTFLGLRSVRKFLRKHRDPETMRVKSMASGLECALVLFCVGAFFLSLEQFEMPYILILLAVQLHAITHMVAKHYDRVAPPAATQRVALPSGPTPAPVPAGVS